MNHVIGLTGYAGVGKSVTARILEQHGYVQLAFADKLKDVLREIDPIIPDPPEMSIRLHELLQHMGWDRAKRQYPEIRRLLQSTAMSVRGVLGEDRWIAPVVEQAEDFKRVVISDMRFPNEVSAFDVWPFELVVVRIVRPGIGPVNDHPSETPLPHDLTFNLDGVSLEQMPAAVEELVTELDEHHFKPASPKTESSLVEKIFDAAVRKSSSIRAGDHRS